MYAVSEIPDAAESSFWWVGIYEKIKLSRII